MVREVRDEFGLQAALGVLGLPRSTWHYQTTRRRSYEEKHGRLRGPLETIARKHPEYGYRRTTTELREVYREQTNHKVVQRLHLLWGLPLIRGTRRPRPSGIRQVLTVAGERANLVAGLDEIGPFEVAYTDFTELVYATGKAQLIAIVDHRTKVCLGWALGPKAVTELALAAWEAAARTLRRLGLSPRCMIVHHDQDPVFTSYGWTGRLLLTEGSRVSYALRGAKDNTEMEAWNSRFKNENRSLFLEAKDVRELRRVVAQRMDYYNGERRHSALGNQAPLAFVAGLEAGR
ncbi:MAG: transposase [Candidatus Eisenbacteria bacterium]|nr:transposase [Candidatus Eisenbacteria bacterium]